MDANALELAGVMQSALNAQRANDYDNAQSLYRKALGIDPENVDALHMLGVVHLCKGELQIAESLIAAADGLCKGAIPAIAYNLAVVRGSAKFARGERTIQSLMGATEAAAKMGVDTLADATSELDTRLIAFYLPQFHRIPENDQWWGEGFTEWTNVRRARPNFVGHYQPHQPAELGYYDLNDEDVLVRQAALARGYGISGFCFYYYWFSGRRILEMPVDRLLRSGKPDFPYCLCWANENWSRNWDGGNREVLLEQKYLASDAEEFILSVIPHLRDRRYIRVGRRPLLMVYRAGSIPNPLSTFSTWRAVCSAHGIESPYIVVASTFGNTTNPLEMGADAVSEFPPHGANVNLSLRLQLQGLRPEFDGQLVSYLQNIANFLDRPDPDYPAFPGIVPSWDNTARRQNDGLCMLGSRPAAFELWLRELVYRASCNPSAEERIVFINAWNEWAEGCHLEPDVRYGRAWLESCKNARAIPRDYQSFFGFRPRSERKNEEPVPRERCTIQFPIEELQRPKYCATLSGLHDGDDGVITLDQGGEEVPGTTLLWGDTLPKHLVDDHERSLHSPSREIFAISNVTLHGPGWASRDDRVLFDPTIYPEYCRHWYESKKIYNAVDVDLSRLRLRHFRIGWHVSHFNCGVYGHWLTEMLPKLLVIREFLKRWPEHIQVPLLMSSEFPQFVYAHTQSVLPYVPIVTFDPRSEYIHCDRVLMPTWGIDYTYNVRFGMDVDSLPSSGGPEFPKRIFVSRRLGSTFRSMDNAKELQGIATQEGLAIVYPEDHTFGEQIALFRNAELVVGEFGSGLHNALFSPSGTVVVALNWINAVQSRVARLRRHRTGYLLPQSGKEVGFSSEAAMRHFSIDPQEFRSKVRNAISVVDRAFN